MDFAAITLFLMFYYVRPQEWISFVSSLRLVALTMLLAMVSTVMRERGFSLKDLFKTPHDWMMFFYFAWIVGTATSMWTTWTSVYAFFVYYIVTVQALSQVERIQRFLNWWTVMILIVAGLAVASEYGFDPLGSYDTTHGIMKDRLVLNTSIFNNPNALGHSVVPVVVMLYFICWWKRPVFLKIGAIPIVALPLYCIYLTQSKGTFLAAFAAVVMALTFNRPKYMQAFILVMALTVGWAGLHLLPRMKELNKAQSDQAIQGRLAAFQFGLYTLRSEKTGLGYGKFEDEFYKVHHYSKAPHSSYVQIGAELGRPGLYLFLGIIYCSLRTLITCKTTNDAQERARRILFVLLICYIVSSWMVGFAFRATFFLMVGAIAALHRQLLESSDETEVLNQTETQVEVSPPLQFAGFRPAFAGTAAALPLSLNQTSIATQSAIPVTPSAGGPEQKATRNLRWNRIGLIDIGLMLLLGRVVERFWAYIIRNI